MKILEFDLSNQYRIQQFINLPFKIYRDIPQWVPPLDTDTRHIFDRQRNPFYKHSEATFFLAVTADGTAIGRLAMLNNRNYNNYNHEQTGFFYLFECFHNRRAARELFEAGLDWAQRKGLATITGPKGFSALDGMGLLVKGFDHRPAFGIPYNPPYYPDLVEESGFISMGDIVSGYLGTDIKFPEKIQKVAELVQQRRGLHIARFRTRHDLRALVPKLKDLYNGTIEGTTGNVPLTDDEAGAMADQLLWFADPRLIKIIMKDDEPVGFLFAYPDISAAVQRTKGRVLPFGWIDLMLEMRRTKWVNINGAGIIEQYRGLGGTAILFSEMFKSVAEGGFEHGDLVQIGVDNDKMQRELRDLGVEFYKTHRIYQRTL
jgi:GNAT superfamily N-acetyltransferase